MMISKHMMATVMTESASRSLTGQALERQQVWLIQSPVLDLKAKGCDSSRVRRKPTLMTAVFH